MSQKRIWIGRLRHTRQIDKNDQILVSPEDLQYALIFHQTMSFLGPFKYYHLRNDWFLNIRMKTRCALITSQNVNSAKLLDKTRCFPNGRTTFFSPPRNNNHRYF